MSDLDPYPFMSSDGIHLGLQRYVGDRSRTSSGRKPVLLLHGGSGSHQTFMVAPKDRGRGLARRLYEADLDPWLLDWRGSGKVVEDPANAASLCERPTDYNFNQAAEIDVRGAIDQVRGRLGIGENRAMSLLGFCMGGGVVADAVARGRIEDKNIDRVVLMTLGLFYETPIDGRLKGEGRLLEHLSVQKTELNTPAVLSIDPRVDAGSASLPLQAPWNVALDSLYAAWPAALKGHDEAVDGGAVEAVRKCRAIQRMCNRMSFMYGMIYDERNLVEIIHGTEVDAGRLPDLFGAIPLQMYIHGAKNIRQGHATFFDPRSGDDADFVSDVARGHFTALEGVTLIGGALDRLWHRDSIDRMYDWLRRGNSRHFKKFRKRVFADYAHQDLLWGQNSDQEVFPEVLTGLLGSGDQRVQKSS